LLVYRLFTLFAITLPPRLAHGTLPLSEKCGNIYLNRPSTDFIAGDLFSIMNAWWGGVPLYGARLARWAVCGCLLVGASVAAGASSLYALHASFTVRA